MDKQLLESDREYVKKEVSKHIDKFFDDFKKVISKLGEHEKLIKKLEYSNKMFARAYAIKLGILITKKQFEKMGKAHKKTKNQHNIRLNKSKKT